MNEVIKNILNRRSVRAYEQRQLSKEDLDLILMSGYNAPSGCNMQSWHFTVIQNKELLNELNEQTKSIISKSENELFNKMGKNERFDIFYNAPSVIVVSGLKSAETPLIDCSAATQNMLLAAESINVGSCWIGLASYLFKSEKAQEIIEKLNIPKGYEPYYAITLGYKKGKNRSPQPRKEDVVNYIK